MHAAAFRLAALAVVAFGVAFGYVEAAVVVDLRAALGVPPEPTFPLALVSGSGTDLVVIERGRELATLVMLAGVGWVTGRSRLERLAWTAVAFGAWDIAYYGWLWLFVGWPPTPGAWDILFLVPVPWVGPVWAPIAVSLALVGFGLAAVHRLRAGGKLRIAPGHLVAGIAGGLLVAGSFTLHGPRVATGEAAPEWAWPLFAAGMGIAVADALHALAGREYPRVESGSTEVA